MGLPGWGFLSCKILTEAIPIIGQAPIYLYFIQGPDLSF